MVTAALSRQARRTPVRLALFSLLATVLVSPVLPDAARINEFRDAHILSLYERAAVDTVLRFHELPLWNPYYCGGFDAVAAPQTRFSSPTFLLDLLFGAARAEILTVFVFFVVGMAGMYRWLRIRGQEPAASLLVAPVFALSGHFAVAYFRGWIQFFGFELVPWILFGVSLAARRRFAGVAIASLAFAWMVAFNGFFAAPMVAIAASLTATREVLEQPKSTRKQSLLMLAIAAAFMAAVSWARLWPVAETLAAAPRVMAGAPGNTPRALLSALVGALHEKDGNTAFEGSFYVGLPFVALVCLGAQGRRAAVALSIAVFFVLLALGYSRDPSMFAMLRQLPIFSAMRYPERFLWLVIFFASEPAAHAVARVPYLVPGRMWRLSAAVALAGALLWTVSHQVATFGRVAKARNLGTISEQVRAEFHQARGNRWIVTHLQSMNIGSLSCMETHRVRQSPLLRGDLPAEEYLAPSSADAGTVRRLTWSPNRIVLAVDVSRPARVRVNQNWAPGWHASEGTVVSEDGLLAVDVPAGAHEIALSFRPWTTIAGVTVTATAIAALAFLVRRARRRGDHVFARDQRVATAIACAAPWVVAGAAIVASPDPRWPAPIPTNPDRSPAIADAATEREASVSGLAATFALPLRIENAHVRGPDAHRNLAIEVDLRRTGSVPRSTGMFVHVERRKGQEVAAKDEGTFFNADHQVIGGSFFLSDAPERTLVRDVFGVHLDNAARGTWDVWVAFGHSSGTRGRAKVTSHGSGVIDQDRVNIGSFVIP